MPGTLYLVSTPIGNDEDITLRALRVLKEADVIVYEERKEGQRLLAKLGIPEKVVESLNEHNEAAGTFHILEHLKQGKRVALISDAGTPLFSDPGRLLVQKVIELDIPVVPVPGASSLLPALTVSGFSIDQFLFYGFLSPKTNRRISELRHLSSERRTMVFMDTPYRLVPLLKDLAAIFADQRRICVAFDLTMPSEKIFRGTALELFRKLGERNLKGEFVIVVEGLQSRNA